MSLIFYFLSILLIGPTTIEGVELGNNNQTHLEVNLVDQCMANPETGPQGRYYSAMRFKFLVNASRECNGSILLCYPGQLDPGKMMGLSVPTTHWAIPNLDNKITTKCNEIRGTCRMKADDCEMRGTPWHGIQIKIGADEQIELKLSIGGSYKFPVTNFTLMLHNNAVNEEANPAAFLVNDYDNQDLCIKQDAFPIAGQSKPVLIKIPLHDNEAKYKEWKKMENVGQDGKLKEFRHLFRLSWDMLPKTQLDGVDEKMYIWMENDVNATCNTRVFFFDRMQTEATNKDICPDKKDTMDIHEHFQKQCPNGMGWKPIKAANLTDQYGSELVVRVGFLSVSAESDEEKRALELSWRKHREELMKDKYPLDLPSKLAYFPFGQFHYASLENDIGLHNMTVDRLEAFVFNCTNYIITTKVQRAIGHNPKKPKRVHPMLDWSKDFDLVNQCKEKQHLLARHTVNTSHGSWDKINLTMKDAIKTGIDPKGIELIMKKEANMTGIDTEGKEKSKHSNDIIEAYKFKFSGRKSNQESADKVERFGRFLSIGDNAYKPQEFSSIRAIFINITADLIKNHTSRRNNTASVNLIKKSCATKNYCNNSQQSWEGKNICEDKNGVYECKMCAEDNCNGQKTRTCVRTHNRNWDNLTIDASFQVVQGINDTIVNASNQQCDANQDACLREFCQTTNGSMMVSLNCSRSYHCNSKENENMENKCEDYRCHLCEEDNCNKNQKTRNCLVTEDWDEADRSSKMEEVGERPMNESKISNGSKLYECPLDAPNSRCVTETCYSDEESLVRKGCVQKDYCTSNKSEEGRRFCENDKDGYYECKVCHGLDYCNGFPRQRCWKANDFVNFTSDTNNYGTKDFECEKGVTQCATEYCKKPPEFVVFGLYVLQYDCPLGINFSLPRFDGAILDGSETEHGTNMTRWRGNLVREFIVDEHADRVDIQVDPNNTRNCLYDMLEEKWMDCKTWKHVES